MTPQYAVIKQILMTVMVPIGLLVGMIAVVMTYTVFMEMWSESKPEIKDAIRLLQEEEDSDGQQE